MANHERHPDPVLTATAVVCQKLTLGELVPLALAATLKQNPRHLAGYDRAKSLFTEEDGIFAHEETARAMNRIVAMRQGEPWDG